MKSRHGITRMLCRLPGETFPTWHKADDVTVHYDFLSASEQLEYHRIQHWR